MRSRLTGVLGVDVPVVQAPMAGSSGVDLAVAVSEAGGLGSLPGALLTPDALREQVAAIRARTPRPFNVNFFCHDEPIADPDSLAAWRRRLDHYYAELDVDDIGGGGGGRLAFGEATCGVVEELRPPIVSFHFGLPAARLVERVKAAGATILSSATTLAEARWLVDHGCDVVIAQGLEAGGHRGMFLDLDPSRQVGTMALVPQIVDAVDVPVIAAGGIADARGIVAALALGADGVQLGTAFLRCPEAMTSDLHRRALAAASDDSTAITNVLTGRPARGIVNRAIAELGPMSHLAPAFPLAAGVMMPLRGAAEAAGSDSFSSLFAGQAAALAGDAPAGDLVRALVADADALLRTMSVTDG